MGAEPSDPPTRRTGGLDTQVLAPGCNGSADGAAALQQFTVHVRDPLRSRTLMQVVDVLRAKEETATTLHQSSLQASQRPVRLVRLCCEQVLASHVVEGVDAIRVSGERLRRREFHRVEARPQPVFALEDTQAALGRDSGAGQDKDVHRLPLAPTALLHARSEQTRNIDIADARRWPVDQGSDPQQRRRDVPEGTMNQMFRPSQREERRLLEALAGTVERVTFHNAESGFAVLKVQARGKRDLVTVVGHAPVIGAGEWVTASGAWVSDRTHGVQFKADVLKTTPPTGVEGIERYLSSGQMRGIGPAMAKRIVAA